MYTLVSALPVIASAQAQVAEQQISTNPLITIIAFLIMLGILVFVHELGHFLVATWMGIRVEEFGIGYPPRAVTLFEHKGVKYTLNWLPLGGFVRFANSDGQHKDDIYGVGSLAAAKPWQKIPVMVAGPLMNLFLTVIVFAVLFAMQGIPTPTGGQRVSEVFPNTPASAAGFQRDDVLLSLNGQPVAQSENIAAVARQNAGKAIPAVVERNGEQLTLTITPGPWVTPRGERYEVGIGVSYGPVVENVPVNLPQALLASTTYTWDLLVRMFQGLAHLPASIGSLFSSTESPAGEPIGPVGIARATGEVIQQGGLLAFWNLMAVLSLNLFLLNLLPIPALDGSHIIFSLIEWVRGGKKVPPDKEALVHAIGFAALMGLMVLISVNDVINAFNGRSVLGGG